MKLEVHTFDPELINVLMRKDAVPEGDSILLGEDVRLTFVRTFSGRVRHFPLILHFNVELLSEQGACRVVGWLFDMAGQRSLEKIMVEYQDVRMDAEQMKRLLGCDKFATTLSWSK